MIQSYGKSLRTVILCIFAIQILTCSTVIGGNNSPAGAEFLKNVIGNLPKLTRKIINDRIDVEEYIPDDVPYPNHGNEIQMLSKLPINYGQNNHPNANRHQSESSFSQVSETQNRIVSQGQQFSNSIPQNIIDALSDGSTKPDATISGYNFFFYPLDNKGLQQMQQNGNGHGPQQMQQNGNGYGPQQTQQNGNDQGPQMPGPSTAVDTVHADGNQMTKSRVEPLFVAMAGFMGVAVVFLSALMFVPRLPIPLLTSKSALKRAPDELAALTKLVTESIDGKDCSERIACEFGRAMRSMKVGSKPIRMMEIILPPSVAKQLAQVRRSATKKEQCHFITCKRTNGTLKMVAKLKKSTNLNHHNKTIHDVREIFNI